MDLPFLNNESAGLISSLPEVVKEGLDLKPSNGFIW
jgi:hypothetical protein